MASTVNIAIGQRLVRKICSHCKEKTKMTPAFKESLTNTSLGRLIQDGDIFYKGKGCKKCGNSGYLGRISINEVLVADDFIREAIIRKATASEINKIAVEHGMVTMLEDGFLKVKEGKTTIEEIFRVIRE
ncbi:MAG: hypothetical protein A3E02_02460 [Candidatus Zambryskibacteria bacterium RIFCSPHIGHO2_12_FULL_38_34]|nr:MAG: hypothetical protein A3E02_02460 [Candidatus Zambryskibacteria bacterium RIFCSPHIGHO2_12_FULL_38_34]